MVAVFLLARGCGGASEADSVRATVTTALREGTLGDPARACAQLSDAGRATIVREYGGLAGGVPATSCEQVVLGVRGLLGTDQLARIGAGRATSVRVVADQASAVVVDVAGEHVDLVLSRSPAGWRIDNVAPNLPGVDAAAGAGASAGQGLPQIPGQ